MTVDSVRRMETELSTELEKRRMGDNIVDSLEELLEQNKDLFHSSHHLITKTKLILSQSYGNTKGHMSADMNKKQMARKIQVTFLFGPTILFFQSTNCIFSTAVFWSFGGIL